MTQKREVLTEIPVGAYPGKFLDVLLIKLNTAWDKKGVYTFKQEGREIVVYLDSIMYEDAWLSFTNYITGWFGCYQCLTHLNEGGK